MTGKQAADVAVLVCGNEFRIYRIERNEAAIARLIDLEAKFWNYVESDTAPPADGSDSAATALQALYPQDDGEILDLSDDVGMCAAFADLISVRASMAEQEKLEATLKQSIQQRMGCVSKAIFEGGDVSWKRSKDGVVLDVAKLLIDQPDLLQRYPLVKTGSRRFLISA